MNRIFASIALSASLFTAPLYAQAPAGAPAGAPPLPSDIPATPPPPARGPSLSLAIEAAQTAIDVCAAAGFHVAASVLDSAGLVKVTLVGDGGTGVFGVVAPRKAAPALEFKMPTSQIAAQAKINPEIAARLAAKSNPGTPAGGIPLKVGDEVIGALGVSGAPKEGQEEACGMAGYNKIKDRLK